MGPPHPVIVPLLNLERSLGAVLAVIALLTLFMHAGSANARQSATFPVIAAFVVGFIVAMFPSGMVSDLGRLTAMWHGSLIIAGTMMAAALSVYRSHWRVHLIIGLVSLAVLGVVGALLSNVAANSEAARFARWEEAMQAAYRIEESLPFDGRDGPAGLEVPVIDLLNPRSALEIASDLTWFRLEDFRAVYDPETRLWEVRAVGSLPGSPPGVGVLDPMKSGPRAFSVTPGFGE